MKLNSYPHPPVHPQIPAVSLVGARKESKTQSNNSIEAFYGETLNKLIGRVISIGGSGARSAKPLTEPMRRLDISG